MEDPSVPFFADGLRVGIDDELVTGAIDSGDVVTATGVVVMGAEELPSVGAAVMGAFELSLTGDAGMGAAVMFIMTGAVEVGAEEVFTMTGAMEMGTDDLSLTGTVDTGVGVFGALVVFSSESSMDDIAGAKIG